MRRSEATSVIMESLLKLAVAGTTLTLALLAPNAMIALEKPLKKYLDKLDDRGKQREVRRVLSYMKSQGLVKATYDHGLQITERGREKLGQLTFDNLQITPPQQWDHKWRIVFYDIPEERKSGRDALTRKLRDIGFFQLQRSVFIHPFPCRQVIEHVTAACNVDRYVTYIETSFIDNEQTLIARFGKQMPNVDFE